MKSWCALLALVAVELAMAHLLFKATRRKKITWTICGVLVLIEFVVLAVVSLRPEAVKPEKPYPNLLISASTAVLPDDEVALTNAFLINRKTPIGAEAGILVMASQSRETNVSFRFIIQNDPNSSVQAETVVFVFSVPKWLGCKPDAGWFSAQVIGSPPFVSNGQTNESQSFTFGPPNSLLPGMGVNLPYVSIPTSETNKLIPIALMIRAKDAPAKELLFWMMLAAVPDGQLAKPRLLNIKTNKLGILDIPNAITLESKPVR